MPTDWARLRGDKRRLSGISQGTRPAADAGRYYPGATPWPNTIGLGLCPNPEETRTDVNNRLVSPPGHRRLINLGGPNRMLGPWKPLGEPAHSEVVSETFVRVSEEWARRFESLWRRTWAAR